MSDNINPAIAATATSDLDQVPRKLSKACDKCKSKKKRCPHRQIIDTASTTATMDATNVSKDRRRTRNSDQLETKGDKKKSPAVSKNEAKQSSMGQPQTSRTPDDDLTLSSLLTEQSSITENDEKDKPVQASRKHGRPGKPTENPKATENPKVPKKSRFPDFPEDNLEGSIALAMHKVFKRQLEDRLSELEAKIKLEQIAHAASMNAHAATMDAAASVKDTVERWVEAWANGM